MSKALRVVCLEPHGVAYVGCPICLVRRQDERECWWCGGNEWERASAWDWSMTPAEWVEEVGGSAGDVRRCAGLTLACPSWLDVKTGHKKPGVDVPAEDVVWVDEEVGGFTDQRPVGPPVTEVAELRTKLAEAEAFIARLVAERTQLWIKVSAHEHVLGKVVGGFNGLLAAVQHAEGFLQGDEPKAPDEVDS